MNTFGGVIPPIITPFDEDGGLYEEAFGKLVDWYVAAGCHGLWVCGGTGEGVSLSSDERVRMVEMAQACVAGRMKVIFHVGAPTTADAVRATRRCQELKVDAVCSVPPFFYGKSDDEIVDYYRRLADETDRPLFLYNLPNATGVELTLPLVERIVDAVPSVTGIKQSAGVVDFVYELLRFKNDLTVLIGRGETMLPAMTLGAKGVVCSSVSLAPERFVAVYNAIADGDLPRAMAAQAEASSVKEIYRRFPVIASTKWINSSQIGLDCGQAREPLARITPEMETPLLELARELSVLPTTVRDQVAATN